ncbi:DUF1015 domain-containing protein [Candidatus Margulisiibacteriota bacterium]
MVKIKPLKGVIPKPELAAQIASPPYDVLNSAEAQEIAKDNEYSFLHIIKSEIDFPKETVPCMDDIFRKAKDNFIRFQEAGFMAQDLSACFYIYQIQMGNHIQTGLVAGASVDEYKRNIIKKHEHTRPNKVEDRAKHIKNLNAQAGPVLITYRNTEELQSFIDSFITGNSFINFVADDGIRHTLWRVEEQKDIDKIMALFSKIPCLYIADGHHRSEAAARFQEMKKKNNPNHTGEENYNYFLTVSFPDDQLKILDYNRCVKDLNNLKPQEIIEKLKDKFSIEKIDVTDPEKAKPVQRGHFSMYLENTWYLLKVKNGLVPPDDVVNSLDAAILQNHILNPILDIDDPRTNPRIDFVGGIRGLKELVKRCHTDCRIAFALYPTGIDQLMNIADANKVMPPKSTWFEPKLRSGLVVSKMD